MKASELINQLQSLIEKKGDREIFVYSRMIDCNHFSSYQEPQIFEEWESNEHLIEQAIDDGKRPPKHKEWAVWVIGCVGPDGL